MEGKNMDEMERHGLKATLERELSDLAAKMRPMVLRRIEVEHELAELDRVWVAVRVS